MLLCLHTVESALKFVLSVCNTIIAYCTERLNEEKKEWEERREDGQKGRERERERK